VHGLSVVPVVLCTEEGSKGGYEHTKGPNDHGAEVVRGARPGVNANLQMNGIVAEVGKKPCCLFHGEENGGKYVLRGTLYRMLSMLCFSFWNCCHLL